MELLLRWPVVGDGAMEEQRRKGEIKEGKKRKKICVQEIKGKALKISKLPPAGPATVCLFF